MGINDKDAKEYLTQHPLSSMLSNFAVCYFYSLVLQIHIIFVCFQTLLVCSTYHLRGRGQVWDQPKLMERANEWFPIQMIFSCFQTLPVCSTYHPTGRAQVWDQPKSIERIPHQNDYLLCVLSSHDSILQRGTTSNLRVGFYFISTIVSSVS